ncbi:MAG: hypothetical protein JNK30_11280 [Phenylobacterium sp.]|uniref:hypothetical protein n=1 Tax=Phenylobacterium sp. TaxID=1871053 RepID=UPI001A558106|nr:hypothetical protein [Phenylobacterium sp.]MBL8771954.1 hypothetical protein [Phenylobacterium sp.]
MSGRVRLLLLVVAASAALAACQTVRKVDLPPPAPPPAPVAAPPRKPPPPVAPPPAPQPRACVPSNLPPAPRYPDSDAALRNAPGAAERYQLLAAGRILRQQRLRQLEAVVEACR